MAIDKAVDSAQLSADLTTVANAIRTKGGTSAQLAFPAGFVSAIQSIPTGGGASNIVTGTFKGTTTGAAMDVNISYTGSGYPIVVVIYPSGGYLGNSQFSSLVQRYAFAEFVAVKTNVSLSPDYTATVANNGAMVMYTYKSSASDATAYSRNGSNASAILNDAAASGSNTATRFRSATKMSVYIASTSYGFAANIEYTYQIIYSS